MTIKQKKDGQVCDLDVHKDSVFMCILTEKGERTEAVFGTTTPELDRLRDVLVAHGVGRVAMEGTSIYWLPVWRVLDTDFELKLVNPYFIRQLPGRKSDVKDAHWTAVVLQKELLKDSFVLRNNNILKKRMNHNKALMANARKLLVVIWNILAASAAICNKQHSLLK